MIEVDSCENVFRILSGWTLYISVFTTSGQGCSMEQMQQIRDQQESLARLHFELGARQETQRDPFSDDGLLRANNEVWVTRYQPYQLLTKIT